MIWMTVLQAYPLYLYSLPFIVIGLMVIKLRSKAKGRCSIYLESPAFVMLCASILLTLAATCYAPDFFTHFDIENLTNLRDIHFEPKNFLENILLASLAGSFHGTVNWIGNILLFVPIGFFAMWLYRRTEYKKTRIVIYCMLFSICIETLQLGYGRLADVIDVLLNTAGSFLGCWIFVYFMALTENLKGRYTCER